jgi:hypothetical protein
MTEERPKSARDGTLTNVAAAAVLGGLVAGLLSFALAVFPAQVLRACGGALRAPEFAEFVAADFVTLWGARALGATALRTDTAGPAWTADGGCPYSGFALPVGAAPALAAPAAEARNYAGCHSSMGFPSGSCRRVKRPMLA